MFGDFVKVNDSKAYFHSNPIEWLENRIKTNLRTISTKSLNRSYSKKSMIYKKRCMDLNIYKYILMNTIITYLYKFWHPSIENEI